MLVCYLFKLPAMKKNIIIKTILAAVVLTGSLSSYAQKRGSENAVVNKGNVIANIGAGVGNDYYDSRNAFGTKAAIEYGLGNAGPGVITIGLETGSSFSNTSDVSLRNDFRARTFVVALRSAWHSSWNVKNLDTYGGIAGGVGFRHYEFNSGNHISESDLIPAFGVFIGASYFFSSNVGFNVEVGRDITLAQVGLVFKLR